MLARKAKNLKDGLHALQKRLFSHSKYLEIDFPSISVSNIFSTIEYRPVHHDRVFNLARGGPVRNLSPPEEMRKHLIVGWSREILEELLKRKNMEVKSVEYHSISSTVLTTEVLHHILFDVTHDIQVPHFQPNLIQCPIFSTIFVFGQNFNFLDQIVFFL